MKYEKYDNIEVSSDALEYQFISSGPKGAIRKIVQFKETEFPDIYNLAFGNMKDDGTIDDLAKVKVLNLHHEKEQNP